MRSNTTREKKLGVVESRFADIVWSNVPLSTTELVKICEIELNWKRTTTYTVLKRLSDHGLFQYKSGMVTALMTRDEFYSKQSEIFVNENFDGSLPAFLAAFASRKKLIDSYEE